MKISVDCYSGYRAEEKPKQFWIKDRKIEIRTILSQWLSPGYRNFKIRGDDNSIYTIELDTESYNWELVSFDSQKVNY